MQKNDKYQKMFEFFMEHHADFQKSFDDFVISSKQIFQHIQKEFHESVPNFIPMAAPIVPSVASMQTN